MILRTGSFFAGALVSTCLIYTWTLYLNAHSPGVLDPKTPSNRATNENGASNKVIGDEPSQEHDFSSPQSVQSLVANSTLGFQSILAIGLPERTDRRDTLSLMSKYQNVDLTWINAVRGDQMSRKAWPPRWHLGKNEGRNLTLPELGCWRSHSNALLKVIEEGYASALIIEDDVDWDIIFRKQLNQFAEASRKLDNDLRESSDQLSPNTKTSSPYGDRWDVLWLGTCAVPSVDGNKRSQTFVSEYQQTHFVYPIGRGAACTFAYAVTQASARLLFGFLQDPVGPVDFTIGDFCENSKECRIVWPHLISSRAIGKESDIQMVDEAKKPKEEGTWYIKNSAVLEMEAQLGIRKEQIV